MLPTIAAWQTHLFHLVELGSVETEEGVVHAVGQLETHQTCHTNVIVPQVQVSDVLVLCQYLGQCNCPCN